jgi:glycosyltransferase involved in cell wall biosynthesis
MTDIKKKALVVIPRMPYPLNSGGRIAIYDAVKLLSKKYELAIVIIDDKKSNEQYIENLKTFSDDIHFFSAGKLSFIFHALIGLLKGKPLQVGYFYFKEVQKLIDELSLSCDFFFSFMIRTATYGLNLNMKKGQYAIDSMYLNYKKSQHNTTSWIWKVIYKIEVPLLYKMERKIIQKFDITTFVNKDEALFWHNEGNVVILPHGVEADILSYDSFDKQYSNIVAFIGRMDYQPNIDGVMWFCNNVVQHLDSGIEFWIIGGYPTTGIKKLSQKHGKVKVLGFVDDPYVILRSCICTVAPMQTGGGLQTKMLMAMAVESLVVATSLPVKAIDGAQNGINLIVENDSNEMAKTINTIYRNPLKYKSIKKMGKKLIYDNYSLAVIEKRLFDLIEDHLI